MQAVSVVAGEHALFEHPASDAGPDTMNASAAGAAACRASAAAAAQSCVLLKFQSRHSSAAVQFSFFSTIWLADFPNAD